MRNGRLALFVALIATITLTARAADKVLPDSCGDPKVFFDAKTEKNAPKIGDPAEGKAQIVLINQLVKKGGTSLFSIHDFTARFGMDGTWLGAAATDSYFTADIEPGEHHLCGDVQSTMSGAKNMIGMKKFTAEAGKTYYFKFLITKVSTFGQNSSNNYYSSDFDAADEDDGKFRIKALPLSISKPKQSVP